MNRFKWTYIVGWMLSMAALGYLVYRLVTYDGYSEMGTYFASISTVQGLWLACAVLLLPVQLMVEAAKWQWLLHGFTAIPLRASLAQVLYGYVGGFITPYRLGEYPARILRMGYSLDDWHTILGSWRDWLHNWHKWLNVLMLHLLRYVVWMLQLWAVLAFCGIALSPSRAILLIPTYYFCISVMPSLPAADIPIKGGWATLIFGICTANTPAILIAVAIIWFINTIIPTITGAFMLKK